MTKISAWKNECPHCNKKISGASVRRKICEHCGAIFTYPFMRYVMVSVTISLIFLLIAISIKACDSKKSSSSSAASTSAEKPDQDSPIYLDRIYGDDAKSIYKVMKSNGILPYPDGTDAAKLSAIVVGGYVYRDDDPCFDGKNPSKCLVFIKEALGSDKYKSDIATLLPRVKPIPVATDEERKKTAHEDGRGACEGALLSLVKSPSSVSFSMGSHVDINPDRTYSLFGSFTQKNMNGDKLKNEYQCKVTLSKLGKSVIEARITNVNQVF
ncbi:MAG: hypothetical protein V4536_08650 [Pseudomonadota bacterium]